MKATIRSKLLGMLVSIGLLFCTSSGISYYYLKAINDSYAKIIDKHTHILANVKEMEVLALQQTNALRGYLLTRQDFIEDLESANSDLHNLIAQTRKETSLPETEASLNALEQLNGGFKLKYESLLARYAADNDQQEAVQIFTDEVLPAGIQLSPITKTIVAREQVLMDREIADNKRLVQNVKRLTAFANLASFALAVLIGILVSRNVTYNLRRITEVLTSITLNKTRQLPRIHVRSSDEIGDIADAFNRMALALEHHAEQESVYKKNMQEQRWLESHVAEITTLYQGIQKLETFAQLLITKVPPLVGACQGLFYVKQQQKSCSSFHRIASYAANYSHDTGLAEFRTGEGLIGQCALENRIILLNEIPEDYLTVWSGTGKASPASVIILPVTFEHEVIAVIELAAFRAFTPVEQLLLQRLASNLGITMNSITGRMQVEKLLEDSQMLTEELQSQSEELQSQQEELKSMNEKLEEQYKSSQLKSSELEAIKLDLEEKARQLALSSRYKSEFLANMSHELRTPLNSMLILARILADNKEGCLTPRQVEYADTIHASGNDLLRLINDILDLSKVEAGKMDVYLHEVSLADICLMIERQFLPVARDKGLEFAILLDENAPRALYTDEQRLLQILKNLLSNAFKFTEQGSVRLHVRVSSDAELTISVSDTGIGIPPRLQELIFEAFQQGDGTSSRRFGGSGLGLAISRQMAQLLGGSIGISSEEGAGSTFTLRLPVLQQAAASAPAPSAAFSEAAAGRSDQQPERLAASAGTIAADAADASCCRPDPTLAHKTVLLVDDDMRNVFALSVALESQQMKVLFADNGHRGMEVLQRNPHIDLILMDIMMPEMDGYEAMQAIRSIPRFQSLPIIALTAKAMKHDKETCIEAGASDYISKPVHLEQLFSLIRVWLCK